MGKLSSETMLRPHRAENTITTRNGEADASH
jgi:hypothetical protein